MIGALVLGPSNGYKQHPSSPATYDVHSTNTASICHELRPLRSLMAGMKGKVGMQCVPNAEDDVRRLRGVPTGRLTLPMVMDRDLAQLAYLMRSLSLISSFGAHCECKSVSR